MRPILSLSAWVAAAALVLISVGITTDVLIRWLFGRSITGVFELTSLVLVASIFFSLGLMQFEKRQIRIDLITSHARGRWAAAFDLIEAIAGLLVFALLLWAGSKEFVKAYQGAFRLPGMIQIPTTVELGFIVFGTALMLAALCRLLVICVRTLILNRTRAGSGPASGGPPPG